MKKFSQNSRQGKDLEIYSERLKSITHDWVKQILSLILMKEIIKKKLK